MNYKGNQGDDKIKVGRRTMTFDEMIKLNKDIVAEYWPDLNTVRAVGDPGSNRYSHIVMRNELTGEIFDVQSREHWEEIKHKNESFWPNGNHLNHS